MYNLRKYARWLYVLFVFAFIVLLFFANTITAAFSSHSKAISPAGKNAIAMSGSNIVFGLDSVFISAGVTQDVEMMGWAYTHSEGVSNNEADKKITLYFVHEKGTTYRVETKIMQRIVMSAYHIADYGVGGKFHTFTTAFPSIGMRNGLYSLYVWVEEADGTTATQQTDDVFIKDKDGLSYTHQPYPYLRDVTIDGIATGNVEEILSSETFLPEQETISYDEDYPHYLVTGFAFSPGQESMFERSYLEIALPDRSPIYYPARLKTSRWDIVDGQGGDPTNLFSGCQFIVPQQQLADIKQLQMRIVVIDPQKNVAYATSYEEWSYLNGQWEKAK